MDRSNGYAVMQYHYNDEHQYVLSSAAVQVCLMSGLLDKCRHEIPDNEKGKRKKKKKKKRRKEKRKEKRKKEKKKKERKATYERKARHH